MRPGQNKRMRGRNNRKGPNPLTRSYESNGPDVKIRGTAHHVAEKYLQLARDAQSSGDPVMAESYLQHAEHYFRLISAAQLAQQQAQLGYVRQSGEPESDDSDDDDDVGGLPDRFASPSERFGQQQFNPSQPPQAQQAQPIQPQPYGERQPYNNDRGGQNGQERQFPDRGDRQQQRNDRPPYQERNDRQQQRHDRPYQDRNEQNRFNQNRGQRDNRPQREQRDYRNEPPREQPQIAVESEGVALPSFITSPVRIAATEPILPAVIANVVEAQPEMAESGGFHLRPRRRRRSRPDQSGDGVEVGANEAARSDLPVGE